MIVSPQPQYKYIYRKPHRDLLRVLFGNFAEAELRDFDDDFANEEPTEDYGYYSDSDLEDDEDEKGSNPAHDASRTGPAIPPHSPGGGGPYYANHTELTNKGKIVRIPDIAFST